MAREEGQRIIGGEVTVENFEELLAEIVNPPAVGCSLLLQRISMNPAGIEDNLDFFRREILPLMKAGPGFCAVRNMISRQTGAGMTGTVWADVTSMDAWARAAEARRQQAAQRGVTFGEQTRREIVFAGLP